MVRELFYSAAYTAGVLFLFSAILVMLFGLYFMVRYVIEDWKGRKKHE